MTSSKEQIGLNKKPLVTIEESQYFLREKWSFLDIVSMLELVSYDYRTYLVDTKNGKFIFKIVNEIESLNETYFEALEQILDFLELNDIAAQRLVKSTDNGMSILSFSPQCCESGKNKKSLKAFLLTYIEGELVINMEITAELCFNIGRELYKLTKTIDNMQPRPRFLEDTELDSIWKLQNTESIKNLIPYIETVQQRQLLSMALNNFEEMIKPILKKLTKGFIHGDPNESNIIVGSSDRVYFIDWQDIGYSYKVYDLAILIFSMILVSFKNRKPMSIEDIGYYCLQGYMFDNPSALSEIDIDVLAYVIECRTAVSLCVGQYTYNYLTPGNEYVLTSAKYGWIILKDFIERKSEYALKWKGVKLQKKYSNNII